MMKVPVTIGSGLTNCPVKGSYHLWPWQMRPVRPSRQAEARGSPVRLSAGRRLRAGLHRRSLAHAGGVFAGGVGYEVEASERILMNEPELAANVCREPPAPKSNPCYGCP